MANLFSVAIAPFWCSDHGGVEMERVGVHGKGRTQLLHRVVRFMSNLAASMQSNLTG